MKLSFKNKRAYLRATLLSVYLKLQQLSLIFNENTLKMRFTLLNQIKFFISGTTLRLPNSGGHKGGYWGYFPPP